MTFLEKNLYILHYIFHEIEHLKEDSKIMKTDYESIILKYGSGKYIYNRYYNSVSKKISNKAFVDRFADKKYKLFYESNWEIIPTERIAEITARKNMLSSFKNYPESKTKYLKEYKVLNNLYINSLKMGYKQQSGKNYNIPIIEYFTNLERLQDIEKLGFDLIRKKLPREANFFDVETKMMYGFPIKPIDVIEINKLKIKGRR